MGCGTSKIQFHSCRNKSLLNSTESQNSINSNVKFKPSLQIKEPNSNQLIRVSSKFKSSATNPTSKNTLHLPNSSSTLDPKENPEASLTTLIKTKALSNNSSHHQSPFSFLKLASNDSSPWPCSWRSPLNFIENTPNTENSQNRFSFEARFMNLKKEGTLTKSKKINGKFTVNQYTITEVVSDESYGKTYRAITENKEKVALKEYNKTLLRSRLVSNEVSALSQVLNEIELIQNLSHEFIIKPIDLLEEPFYNKFYLIHEDIEGSLHGKAPLTEELALKYFTQIIQGVEYLHEIVNIVHRDLKPQNFLLDSLGNVKITGFGLSGKAEEYLGVIGTYAYMPPEAFRDDKRSGKAGDIWSLGVSLYYLVGGKVPYISKNSSAKMRYKEVCFPESFSEELKELLSKIFEKDPENRITLRELKDSNWINKRIS